LIQFLQWRHSTPEGVTRESEDFYLENCCSLELPLQGEALGMVRLLWVLELVVVPVINSHEARFLQCLLLSTPKDGKKRTGSFMP
jgi:hypothetical protein